MQPEIFKKQGVRRESGRRQKSYRNFYSEQNLLSVRASSLVFLSLNLLIRFVCMAFPVSLIKAQNFPEFNLANWIYIITCLFFFIGSHFFIQEYKLKKRATTGMSLFIFVFALYMTICGMYTSFAATSNPRNALIFYLITLILVATIFIFEFFETILVMVTAEVLFTLLLIDSHVDPTQTIYNQLISITLLIGFFLISRYFFTFKNNYYQQVDEIREKNIEIEKASDFKSQLLGTVAHDLRNPLAAVETLAMMMEMDEIDAGTQESVNLIKTSCQQARHIIDDLLEAARNENITEFTTQKTELNSLLRDVINSWNFKRGNKSINIISTVNPAYAAINSEKFRRLMDNLIGNALKFSQDKSNVDISLVQLTSWHVIAVKDNGVGIPADMLPIIFSPFSKAGRTGLNGEQSTGLGLSIVKQLIEKHNGTIDVESEEGVGSIFTIKLPVVPA